MLKANSCKLTSLNVDFKSKSLNMQDCDGIVPVCLSVFEIFCLNWGIFDFLKRSKKM